MFAEVSLLNRLFKSNEFISIKGRIFSDADTELSSRQTLLFVHDKWNKNLKLCTHLAELKCADKEYQRVLEDGQVVKRLDLLKEFGIDEAYINKEYEPRANRTASEAMLEECLLYGSLYFTWQAMRL